MKKRRPKRRIERRLIDSLKPHPSQANIFDDLRRSKMILALAAIHARDLLEPGELAEFTSKTRARIESLGRELSR